MDRPRRALAALAAGALLVLGGCSAVFDAEYTVSEPYQAPAVQEDAGDIAYDNITDYAALRRAIVQLVSDRVPSAQLQFVNYEGSISQDISAACWAVKSSTAIGSFAVDYISYDLSRIVSYYQAQVNIAYKRSASQIEALEPTIPADSLPDRLAQALLHGESYLVLGLEGSGVTAGDIYDHISRAYYADPLLCPVLPEAEVGLYPETGTDRIAEITLRYGMDEAALAARRQELADALAQMTAEAQSRADAEGGGEAELVYALCLCLTDRCGPAQTGSTAWDALTGGGADSEGMALALEAGCQALGIDCRTVTGRMDGESHCWNIVTLDGTSYHVDISGGETDIFLAGDEDLWGVYWWDTSQYPACPEDYGFFPEPTPEPTPVPTPEPTPFRSPAPMTI